MKAQLFVDSIRILFSNLQTSTIKLLSNNSPLSHKVQDLSLNLLSFKSSLIKSIQQLFLEQNLPVISTKLQQQSTQASTKLKKLQLHAFLKKKLKKMHKQSMIHSISQNSFDSSFLEDPLVNQLKNSMVLIEKDLGINDQYDEKQIQISTVIKRSMQSLEITPVKNYVDKQLSDTSMRMDDSFVLPQNHQMNVQIKKIQKKKQQTKTDFNKPTSNKLPTKKKKVIVSTTNTNSKGGMFDNLLQESLQTCFTNPQKL